MNQIKMTIIKGLDLFVWYLYKHDESTHGYRPVWMHWVRPNDDDDDLNQ